MLYLAFAAAFAAAGFAFKKMLDFRTLAAGRAVELEAALARLRTIESDLEKAKAGLRTAEARLKQVEPYLGIVDAHAETQRLVSAALADAKRAADAAHAEAERILAEAKAQARERTQKADERLERAGGELAQANQEAARIIEQARQRAEQIAGDAYKALQNADHLKGVVKALENKIEGYGDRYVVPTYSLLDELADAYGFEEAGQALRRARDRSKAMVEENHAADCEYVEKERRETAIRFVVDAFNGKVDTILARVKSDNYGTLRQETLDAFALVNQNGTAFKDARILPEYLESRLEELKWAEAVVALKERDREEQRRIKEQIREEERAQRDFERAQREAAKEEDAVHKAMERMQGLIAKATDEQRVKYESQMAELQARLVEAENNSKRALSMAQQTKAGHVYVISNVGSFGEHVYKVGMTRRLEPLDRIAELGDASVPFPFDVHAMLYSENAPDLERKLHKKLLLAQVNKVNPRKEFFRTTVQELKTEMEGLGVLGTWTLAAAAAQFKETQVVEERLQNSEAAKRQWIESQLRMDPVSSEDREIEKAA